MVISNLDFDKRRKEKKEKEENKVANSKPWHFPKEMADSKTGARKWKIGLNMVKIMVNLSGQL